MVVGSYSRGVIKMKLSVENGSFAYTKGINVLNNINFEVKSGEMLAILGPNGVGKTTLLRCIMGMLKWQEGRSALDDHDINKMSAKELWRKVAYVPQAKVASSAFTAFETVLLGRSSKLSIFSSPGPEDVTKCEEIMEYLGITKLHDKKCSDMSGGEFQMVLIARALAAEPEILILDEPESNLDFKNQLVVLDAMSDLVHKNGMACIFNTHYPAHALQRANKALVLTRDGSSTFGDVSKIIDEAMIQKAFGVEAIIGEIETPGNIVQSVIPLKINNENYDSSVDDNPEEDVIASLNILFPRSMSSKNIDSILRDYNQYIIGRMGLHYRRGDVKIIHITLDGPKSEIAKLTQNLNTLPDLSVKCVYAK